MREHECAQCDHQLNISKHHHNYVIGRCGGEEKPNDHAEPTIVERYEKLKKV